MIFEKRDIREYDCGELYTLMHGCNAQGVMGSGIAKVIKETWPYAFEAYNKEHQLTGLDLGRVIPAIPEESGKPIILNAITQQFYGKDGKRYASYEAIRSCFMQADYYMGLYNSAYLVMPKIGCGLGGCNWDIVETIANETLVGNYGIIVVSI